MNKIKSAGLALTGLSAVVLGWAMENGIDDITALDFRSVPLLLVVVGWATTYLSKSPLDVKMLTKDPMKYIRKRS